MGKKAPRSPAKRAYHRREIAKAYLQRGERQADIADHLGISQALVSKELKGLQEVWQREANALMGQHKAELLAEINMLQAEAWTAYDASGSNKEDTLSEAITTDEVVSPPSGSSNEQEFTFERKVPATRKTRTLIRQRQSDPDPEYLKIVQWCIQQKAGLFGLNNSKEYVTLGSEDKLVQVRYTNAEVIGAVGEDTINTRLEVALKIMSPAARTELLEGYRRYLAAGAHINKKLQELSARKFIEGETDLINTIPDALGEEDTLGVR